MHDDRLNQAWDAWRQEQLALDPEKDTPDFAHAFAPFVAGWYARTAAASKSWMTSDETLIQDQFEMFSRGYQSIFDHMVNRVDHEKKQAREIEQLRAMIRRSGLNPDDAPAYQRIGRQRKEIRRLLKEAREREAEWEGITVRGVPARSNAVPCCDGRLGDDCRCDCHVGLKSSIWAPRTEQERGSHDT